jgi:hypothetical protein
VSTPAVLPETVTLPTEAVIEAAATLFAFDYLASVMSGRTSPNVLDQVFYPTGRELLKRAGLYTRDREPENDVEDLAQAMLDRRESELTAQMLERIAEWATAEAEETRRCAAKSPFATLA